MRSIVVANWKMNPASWREAKALFEATKKAAGRAKDVSLVVAPPSLYLRELASGYRGGKLSFAAQNAHWDSASAHTGELSMAQIQDAGAKAVIIGHAERRALGETNEDTRKKVALALREKLTPILCVGELRREHTGEHFTFIKEQLRQGLADAPVSQLSRVLIAYEPVWAIGGFAAMEPVSMHEMSIFVRKSVVEARGEKGHGLKVLYGGAVDAENARDMLRGGDVAGLLVGRVSAEAQKFAALLQAVQSA